MPNKLTSKFENIFIHESARDSEVAERFEKLFAPEKIRHVDIFNGDRGELSAREFNQSKKIF